MSNTINNWSVILRDLRTQAGMTQAELAYRADMSQRTVSEYENFNVPRELSIYKVETILAALGYELDAIKVDTADV